MAAAAAATTASRCTKTTNFFPFSPTTRPLPSPKFNSLLLNKQVIYSNFGLRNRQPQISQNSCKMMNLLRSVSSPENAVIEEEEEESGSPSEDDDDVSLDSVSVSSLTGCKACGKNDIERGCNGEGRIQGGIATVPGFGWWPIKAYRPCPAYVASGGRYRRTGQSMDEVVSGSGGSKRTSGGANSSKKKEGAKKSKR